MPGEYVVAAYMDSLTISNLYYDSPETYAIDFTCLVNSNRATIEYQILNSSNEVVDWVEFDPSTSNITITPPYYLEDTTVNLILRSTVTYFSSQLESSDSVIDKQIVLNIMAAGS